MNSAIEKHAVDPSHTFDAQVRAIGTVSRRIVWIRPSALPQMIRYEFNVIDCACVSGRYRNR